MKAYPGDGRATIAWPDFGAGENYVVQIEKSNGDWKTVTSDVTDPDSGLPKYLDNQATIKDLKNGKEYQVRVVSAADLADAEAATEPAVDVAGAGKGSSARIPLVVNAAGSETPITSQSQTVTPAAYKLTLVARYCSDYTDIQRNRADNNLRETFAQLGAVANPPYTDTMANNPITPAREAQKNINCQPLEDWQFTLGTGITGGTPSDPSIVTGAYGGAQPRTLASVPELDASGNPLGSTVAGAVTVSLTQDQITKVQSSSSLWIQGGKPAKGANYTGKQVNQDETKFQKADGTAKYAFATLRCVVDNLNGDNVEWAYYSNSVRHGFCYAYYVDNPNYGTIVIKKTVDGTDPVQGGTTFDYTGTVSYFANGAFSLKGGGSQTFEREPRDATGDAPWSVKETPKTGWNLKDLVCASKDGSSTTINKTTGEVKIALKKGDRVECTYTNTQTANPAVPAVEKVVKRGDATLTDTSTVAPGDVLTYAVTVKNNAGSGGAALSGTVEDTPDLSYVSNPTAISDSGVFAAPKITWTVTNLAAGATKTLTYQVTVNANAPNGQNVTNYVVFKTPQGNPEDRTTNPITNPGKPVLEKVSDPEDGEAVEKGDTITYTVTVSNTGGAAIEEDLTDTLPDGVTLDKSSVQRNGDDVPGADFDLTERVLTFYDVTVAANSKTVFTYDVTVTAGFGSEDLVNTARWPIGEDEFLERSTTHPVKAITVDVVGFCELDAPYYSLKITPTNGALFSDQKATVTWYQANAAGEPIDADGNPTSDPAKYVAAYDPSLGTPSGDFVDEYTLVNGALNLPKILWKGAAVDGSGKATAWPGWILNADGSWSQVDSGGVRPGMFAVVKVNPTATSKALYPPAASGCANPPGVPGVEKTAIPPTGSTVTPNQEISYTVTLTNKGGTDVTSDLVDTLPKGVTFVAGSATRSDSGDPVQPVVTGDPTNGQVLTWPKVTVPASALTEVECPDGEKLDDVQLAAVNESESCTDGGPGTVTFTYKVKVNADVADKTVLVNSAKWAEIEKSTTHNVTTQKGITITKSVSGSDKFVTPEDFFFGTGTRPGNTAVYRFEVTNTGSVPVTDLVVGDNLIISNSATNPATSGALTEDSISNCRVGSLDSTTLPGLPFTFDNVILNGATPYVLAIDNPATPDVNEGKVYLYCDLKIPSDFKLAPADLIYNTATIDGKSPLGDVTAKSNVVILDIVPADIFPAKLITDADGSNGRKFDNLAKPTQPTTVYFGLKIENRSTDALYVTSYDYFENQSLGLSDTARRTIFDSMKCAVAPATTDRLETKLGGGEFFSDTTSPRFVDFAAADNGGGAGTFYSRSRYIGLMQPRDQVALSCTAVLPAGEFNLVNTLRMVADPNPPAGKSAESVANRSIMAIPASIVRSLSSLVRSATEAGVDGKFDLTASAGVVLGVPTAAIPGITKTANPASGSTVALKAPITYTVVVSNSGGTEVTGPVVDTLPAGFTATASSISDGGTLDGNKITWNVTLAGGASKTLTYSGTVNDNVANNTSLINTVTFQNLTATTTHTVTVPAVTPPVQGVEDEVVEDEVAPEEVVAAEEDLADTGANNVGNIVAAALLAMLAGGLMVTFGRRRREE